jgi:hypothetical protein
MITFVGSARSECATAQGPFRIPCNQPVCRARRDPYLLHHDGGADHRLRGQHLTQPRGVRSTVCEMEVQVGALIAALRASCDPVQSDLAERLRRRIFSDWQHVLVGIGSARQPPQHDN